MSANETVAFPPLAYHFQVSGLNRSPIKEMLACMFSENVTPEILEHFADTDNAMLANQVAIHQKTSLTGLHKIVDKWLGKDDTIVFNAALHEKMDANLLSKILPTHLNSGMFSRIAGNPETPVDILMVLTQIREFKTLTDLARNPSSTVEVIEKIIERCTHFSTHNLKKILLVRLLNFPKYKDWPEDWIAVNFPQLEGV